MKGKDKAEGEGEETETLSQKGLEMFDEILNKTKHDVVLNGKTLEKADEPAEVRKEEHEKGEIHGISAVGVEYLNTINLPRERKEERTAYIVNEEVFNNEPSRVDLLKPHEAEFEGDRLRIDSFDVHPDFERPEAEIKMYPRDVNCKVCGNTIHKKNWGVSKAKREGIRYVMQLNEMSPSGKNSYLTVQMPDIRKEVDLMVKNGELIIRETEISSPEELKYDTREM